VRHFAEEIAPAVRELVATGRGAEEAEGPVVVSEAPALSVFASPTAPLAAVPTPDAGRRLNAEQPWDESTRPTAAPLDTHREYTPQEQAAGQHLIDVHDHLRSELTQLRQLVAAIIILVRRVALGPLPLRVMARNQPVARDMRLVIAAIKITTDLERMGDLAANIVERSLSLMHQPPLDAKIDIGRLCSMVENMVMGVLDSFVKQDSDAAAQIMSADDAVDRLRNEISKELLNCMQNDPSTIVKALDLLFIARGLERIADHATNIAEDVIFLVQGIDVRHQTESAASPR